MPKLTPEELELCARACRAFAHSLRRDVAKIENPDMKRLIEKRGADAAALAERFEKARKRA